LRKITIFTNFRNARSSQKVTHPISNFVLFLSCTSEDFTELP